jgi:nitrate reductase gamma subunit
MIFAGFGAEPGAANRSETCSAAAAVDQLPYLLTSAAFIVFVIAVLVRIVFWVRLPAHLRWELYPVPHEPPDKARYGGSFMEDTDWWERPHETFKRGALRAMAVEIFLLSAVREHNRRLWFRTFPFHFGLYLTAVAVVLALLNGVVRGLSPQWQQGSLNDLARNIVLVAGVAGLTLSIFGAAGLMARRLTAPELKRYTVPADIFNLAFFMVAFGCGLLTWALTDRDAVRAMEFAANLVSLHWSVQVSSGGMAVLPTLTVALLSLLIAYIPLTHMSHFVGKYFAYHSIRWDDTPNLAGGPQEATIQRLLAYRVSWPAPHIKGNGDKTWADLALSNPTEKKP